MKPKALTFDYFGTLVDVTAGGTRGIEGVLQHLALTTTQTAADVYADWDRRTVQGYRSNAYRRYRDVAQQALKDCLEALHEGSTREQDMAALTELLLTHLVESSPPFDDAVAFLDWARDRFVLMPITNMDTDLWRRSRLVEYFPKVTTAEMFHCSIGTWADIDGAKPLGIKVAWINRGAEKLGDFQARPDYEFTTLEPVRSVLEHLINE
jgi:FMN phosphatase YigB (HAD superfamily)